MLSILFIFAVFSWVIYKTVFDPWIGVVGFYFFLTLDPAWNWRWALPDGFRYQFYIFIAIMAGFAFRSFQYKKISKTSQWGLTFAFLLFLLLKLSEHFSIAPSYSNAFMNTYWKTQALFLLTILLIDTPRKCTLLLSAVATGIFYNAYQINLEYFQLGYCRYARMSFWGSYDLDNNTLSIMLVPAMCIGLAGIFTQRVLWIRVLSLLVAATTGHELMLLESRGTWLGAITSLVLVGLFLPKGRQNLTYALVLLVITAALAGPPVIEEWNSIFPKDGQRDESAESRFDLWEAGWEITKEHPVLGVGPNAARVLVPAKLNSPVSVKALHNLFFDVSTSAGIPALILFVLVGMTSWVSCFNNYNKRDMNELNQFVQLSVLTGLPTSAMS
ncbi:O-antigen ligase family protein [bacterium]|nr:O-antigen ligase family protein [bacterium]